ncbi:MAG: flagellar protein [Lachnospiraceae bacterium]|nr:flagellar protein [Lachnospiraceae bacterium]
MDVRNCRKCGKLFNYISGPPICPNCKQALEDKFLQVREYIRDNRTATVEMICTDCEVDSGQLRQWIREERLEFSDDSPINFECENCGATIKTGRYCQKCKNEMAGKLESSFRRPEAPKPEKKDSGGSRMRFLDSK